VGVIAGVLDTLPFVGPSVAVALITLAAFLQFHEVEPTAAASGIATLIAVLEGNLVSPWLTGHAGELNTVALFVSVLFWGGCGACGDCSSPSPSWWLSKRRRIT
jgi:predicted PurR-regulated permease PerM